jgi:hypothetical protein
MQHPHWPPPRLANLGLALAKPVLPIPPEAPSSNVQKRQSGESEHQYMQGPRSHSTPETYRITDIGALDDCLTQHDPIVLFTALVVGFDTRSDFLQSSDPGEMKTHVCRQNRRIHDPSKAERLISR